MVLMKSLRRTTTISMTGRRRTPGPLQLRWLSTSGGKEYVANKSREGREGNATRDVLRIACTRKGAFGDTGGGWRGSSSFLAHGCWSIVSAPRDAWSPPPPSFLLGGAICDERKRVVEPTAAAPCLFASRWLAWSGYFGLSNPTAYVPC